MCVLSFEYGMTTVSWYAELALRIRVSMSAIGSVMVIVGYVPFSPWFPPRAPARGAEAPGLRRRVGFTSWTW